MTFYAHTNHTITRWSPSLLNNSLFVCKFLSLSLSNINNDTKFQLNWYHFILSIPCICTQHNLLPLPLLLDEFYCCFECVIFIFFYFMSYEKNVVFSVEMKFSGIFYIIVYFILKAKRININGKFNPISVNALIEFREFWSTHSNPYWQTIIELKFKPIICFHNMTSFYCV